MKDKNIIGINGSFLRKPATGMGQVSWHFLRELIGREQIDLSSKRQYIIYVEEEPSADFRQEELPKNVQIKIIKGWYKRDDLVRKILWEKFWLPRQVKKDRCNKFFSPYQSATVLPRKIKHLMFVHDVIPNIFPEYLNNWRKKIYYYLVDKAVNRASSIMTNSYFSQKEIARVYGIKRGEIKVAYLACDPIFQKQLSDGEREKNLQKYGLKLSDKFILYEGGLDVRKNVGRIIKAYGKLIAEFKNSKGLSTGKAGLPAGEAGKTSEKLPNLVIAGKFNKHLVPLVTDIEKESNEVVAKYGLDKEMIKMVGFVEQKDLPAFFQSAEIFLYPSLYEGFGMPALEAMTSRVPVVTSNVASIPEVISREAGYLINNPESVDEIKEVLKKSLTDNPKNRERKISLAYRESQKFSWEKFTDEILKELS